MTESTMFDFIKEEVAANDVVLFMKGTRDFPMCKFSAIVVSILKALNIDFKDHNVLANEELRATVKEFSDWPTIPQLYVKGEFVGGCDIVKEMYENGDMVDLFVKHNICE